MAIVTGEQFANAAQEYAVKNIPYSVLDCQGFVERVLLDCGIKKDWRGSNDMWRNALSWKGTVDECLERFGRVPIGAWLFTIRHDGKEPSRYTDGVNAAHVGIYTARGAGAMHSTAPKGVQMCEFPDANRWTHVGLASCLSYDTIKDTSVQSAESKPEYVYQAYQLLKKYFGE